MQKLHLVGFTTELDGLILSARKGSRSGSFVVPLDDGLLEAVVDAIRRRDAERDDGDRSLSATAARLAAAAGAHRPRHDSALSVREMQERLRSGLTIEQVADEAGVDVEWVSRFAPPVVAEQARVVDRARTLVFDKPRVGPSRLPLGDAVTRNVAGKGVRLGEEELDGAWTAHQVQDDLWAIRFAYVSRGREQEAIWLLDVEEGELSAGNRLASQLAHVATGGRARRTAAKATGRRAPAKKAPARRTAAKKVTGSKKAKKAAGKRAPARKTAAKKVTGSKKAKKAAGKKAPARKSAARKAPGRKSAARKASGRKGASRSASAGKAAPRKQAGRRSAARRTGGPRRGQGSPPAPSHAAGAAATTWRPTPLSVTLPRYVPSSARAAPMPPPSPAAARPERRAEPAPERADSPEVEPRPQPRSQGRPMPSPVPAAPPPPVPVPVASRLVHVPQSSRPPAPADDDGAAVIRADRVAPPAAPDAPDPPDASASPRPRLRRRERPLRAR